MSILAESATSCAVANSENATAAAVHMNLFMNLVFKPRQGATTCITHIIAYRSLAALPAQVLWVCSQPVGQTTFWAPL
jgi:hypothetical protein